MSHKSSTTVILIFITALTILAALTPPLIALSRALVPLVVAVGVAVAILRLVFFHTRRW